MIRIILTAAAAGAGAVLVGLPLLALGIAAWTAARTALSLDHGSHRAAREHPAGHPATAPSPVLLAAPVAAGATPEVPPHPRYGPLRPTPADGIRVDRDDISVTVGGRRPVNGRSLGTIPRVKAPGHPPWDTGAQPAYAPDMIP